MSIHSSVIRSLNQPESIYKNNLFPSAWPCMESSYICIWTTDCQNQGNEQTCWRRSLLKSKYSGEGPCADKSIIRQTILLQKRAIRIITNSAYNSHTDPKFKKQGILKLNDLFEYQSILFMYDYMSGNLPRSFVGTFPLNQDLQQAHTTRQSDLLYIPRCSSKYAKKIPEYLLPKIWNKWARSVPQNSSRNIIENTTKSKLLMSYPENVKCENVRCIECHRRQ